MSSATKFDSTSDGPARRPRKLPVLWILLGGLVLALVVFVLAYAVLASRFFALKPTIARNYWQEINSARAAPDHERAWPLYRAAGLALTQEESELISNALDYDPEYDQRSPEYDQWPQAVELLKRHQRELELIREAAGRPHLGFYLGDPDDLAAARAANKSWLMQPKMALAGENEMLIGADLSGIQLLRMLARLVTLDARAAALAGDGETVRQDLQALISLSEQLFQPRATTVEQLVGIAIFGIATEELGRVLDEHPEVLSDSQLHELAKALSGYRSDRIVVDFASERIMFDDLLQRIYSDDGGGDGTVTPIGLQTIDEYLTEGQLHFPPAMPLVASLVAGRAETRVFYNRTLDGMLAAREGPPWTWRHEAIEASAAPFQRSAESPLENLRHPLPLLLLPALSAARSAGERSIQARDAALAAIALVLFHRRHGAWPERLEQLVPEQLAAVPLDRYDGQPLRYTLQDGQPLLYSVGVDRHDDGGRPAEPPYAAIGSFDPLPAGGKSTAEGDWILWPPPEPPSE